MRRRTLLSYTLPRLSAKDFRILVTSIMHPAIYIIDAMGAVLFYLGKLIRQDGVMQNFLKEKCDQDPTLDCQLQLGSTWYAPWRFQCQNSTLVRELILQAIRYTEEVEPIDYWFIFKIWLLSGFLMSICLGAKRIRQRHQDNWEAEEKVRKKICESQRDYENKDNLAEIKLLNQSWEEKHGKQYDEYKAHTILAPDLKDPVTEALIRGSVCTASDGWNYGSGTLLVLLAQKNPISPVTKMPLTRFIMTDLDAQTDIISLLERKPISTQTVPLFRQRFRWSSLLPSVFRFIWCKIGHILQSLPWWMNTLGFICLNLVSFAIYWHILVTEQLKTRRRFIYDYVSLHALDPQYNCKLTAINGDFKLNCANELIEAALYRAARTEIVREGASSNWDLLWYVLLIDILIFAALILMFQSNPPPELNAEIQQIENKVTADDLQMKKSLQGPGRFFDPVSYEILEDPMIGLDQKGYSRQTICGILQDPNAAGNFKSPWTNQVFTTFTFRPHLARKKAVEEFLATLQSGKKIR